MATNTADFFRVARDHFSPISLTFRTQNDEKMIFHGMNRPWTNSWPIHLILTCHFRQGVPRRSLYERPNHPQNCWRAKRAHNFVDFCIFRKDFS